MPEPTRPQTPDDTIGARDLTAWRTRFGRWLVDVFAGLARASRPAARRVRSWSSAHVAFVVFAVIALVVMVVLVEGIETVYEGVAGRDGLTAVDQPVLDAAITLRSPGSTPRSPPSPTSAARSACRSSPSSRSRSSRGVVAGGRRSCSPSSPRPGRSP